MNKTCTICFEGKVVSIQTDYKSFTAQTLKSTGHASGIYRHLRPEYFDLKFKTWKERYTIGI